MCLVACLVPAAPPEPPSAHHAPPIDPSVHGRISRRFQSVLERCRGRNQTIADLENMLSGEGFTVLVLLLSLPFILPVPLPISLPFGLAIFFFSASIALGRDPWLPSKIRHHSVPGKHLEKILAGVIRLTLRIEKFAQPRLGFMENRTAVRAAAWGMAFGGLLLCLPLPIPGTNCLPALSIILLATGILEKDGLFVCGGFVFSALAIAYIGATVWAGKSGVFWLWQQIS